MKIRAVYPIKQLDQTLLDNDLRRLAQEEIVRQLTEVFIAEFGNQILREEPTPKYPYGRFFMDIELDIPE